METKTVAQAFELSKLAIEAALKYDARIQSHAWKGENYVEDPELDRLYEDWIAKAHAAAAVIEAVDNKHRPE